MAEVLFVDDMEGAAESFAEQVHNYTGLSTMHTDSRVEALRIVREEPIKVVVLDQRMESGARLGTRGTRLYEEILVADGRIRCLIYSGQSTEADYQEMLGPPGDRSPEDRVAFLAKSEAAQLPARVLRLYQEYNNRLFREYRAKSLSLGKHRHWLRTPTVDFELLAEEDIGKPDYAPEDFRTVVDVSAGEQHERRALRRVEEGIRFEDEVQDEFKIGAVLGEVALNDLRAHLSRSKRQRMRMEQRKRGESETKIVESISEVDQKRGVVQRRVEVAPYYQRRRAVIKSLCTCCGGEHVLMIPFKEPTGRYHRRQIFTFADNRTETVDLGSFKPSQ